MTTKQIAQTIKDAFQIQKENYPEKPDFKIGLMTYGVGHALIDMEEAFQQACEKNKIDPDMFYLLSLSSYWGYNLQEWADDILEHGSLEGKFVTEMLKEDTIKA